MEVTERIIQGAEELFHKRGIRTVTMDDIAKHLQMSKKTIYKYFRDKNDLVINKTVSFLDKRRVIMEETRTRSANAIEEMFMVIDQTAILFQEMTPSLFYDMQKQHPLAWEKFRTFKEENIIKRIENNLSRGISEGLYREDINLKIIARLRTEEVEMAMRPEIYNSENYNLPEVQQQLLLHFLYGIATLKGHEMISRLREARR